MEESGRFRYCEGPFTGWHAQGMPSVARRFSARSRPCGRRGAARITITS